MAGHSRWANIKRKKGAADKKRGKIFTKLIKEVTVASKMGGPDVDGNARLRLAVQNARGANVPKDTIERAIKKGSGSDGTDYLEVTYEGYGLFGVAIFIESTTDNINRTVQNIRVGFSRYGGSLGTNGSLEFIFTRKGVFTLVQPEKLNEDEFILELIDQGAEEVEFSDGYITVICAMTEFGNIQKFLETSGLSVENSELQRVPNSFVKLKNDELEKIMKLIDFLEDDDDIQKVYHNIELGEEQYHLIA